MTPVQEALKEKLLDALAHCNVVSSACSQAGIGRDTFYRWCKEGFITQAELDDAHHRFLDYLRQEWVKRALDGVETPLLNNGRIVRDTAGNLMTIRKADSRLFQAMLEKLLPELRHGDIEKQGDIDGIPPEYAITFDARLLTKAELHQLKDIAVACERRKIYGLEEGATLALPYESQGIIPERRVIDG